MRQVQPEHLGVGVGGTPLGAPTLGRPASEGALLPTTPPGAQSCAAEEGGFRVAWERTKKCSPFWGPGGLIWQDHCPADRPPKGAPGPKASVGTVTRTSAPSCPAYSGWLLGTEHQAL